MGFTDIRFDLIAQLPRPVRRYALLMRLDRPIGWWLLLLPGWWGIASAGGGMTGMGAREWLLMALFFIGAIIMRGAGCIINDIWDRDLDRKVDRTAMRPLAAGMIGLKMTFVFLLALLAIGFVILLQLPSLSVILGCASMILVVTYPLMKRLTWWPQIFLGLTFSMSALIGYAAVDNNLSLTALYLYVAGIFWTLGYDTIYAQQDVQDDALVGIKSTARLFGERSKVWVSGFFAMTIILLALAVLQSAPVAALLWLTPAACHFIWQMKSWNRADNHSSLAMFKSNRDAGLLVLLTFLFV